MTRPVVRRADPAAPDGIAAILEQQRQALVRRDLDALQASSAALAQALNNLREGGERLPTRQLRELRAMLRGNAELLARARAGNERALGALLSTDAPGGVPRTHQIA
jgi:hypothetical protein